MKTIGNRGQLLHKGVESFERASWLLEFAVEFRKKKDKYIPKGIYRFSTFKEAEQCRHQMLLGEKPDLQQ
ncbi:MAG: hypothetical protein ISS28_03970 [Candidatus Cloacimonetes bacterium]|nr:hypothetical protein [Candidatus Cloacimonadota bacterium]MBL7086243.1 hypothetical protein [Candidatus Cloacimonadota bacterium]